MTELKELFHQVGNWHNKISVLAGLTKAELKKQFKDSVIPEEIEKVLARLTLVEKHAVEVSSLLNQLKDLVYKKIVPDIKRPKKAKKGGS